MSHRLAVALSAPDAKLACVASLITSATSIMVFGVLVHLFRRLFWRTWFAAPLYWFTGATRPPRLNGVYETSIAVQGTFEEVSPTKPTRAIIEIRQDWDKLLVICEVIEDSQTPWVRSTSDMATIRTDMDPDRLMLQYTYHYESVTRALDGTRVVFRPTRGTCVLMFGRAQKKWRASGQYYNDDGGAGTITLTRAQAAASGPPPPETGERRRRRLWGLRALPQDRPERRAGRLPDDRP
ncbi:MAG: hypothetical protein ABUR63_02065 [Verrucomicrobiota bacterium]